MAKKRNGVVGSTFSSTFKPSPNMITSYKKNNKNAWSMVSYRHRSSQKQDLKGECTFNTMLFITLSMKQAYRFTN